MAFDVEEYIRERRKKQTGNTATTDKESFDVEEYIKQRRTPEVANTLSSRFNSWLSDYDNLAKEYTSRYSNVDTSVYRSDTEDWFTQLSERTSNHYNEGQEIKSIVEQYKNYLDPEWVSSFYDALTNANKMQRDMVKGATQERDYWSQWESEAQYNYDYDNYTYGTKYEGMTYADIQKAIATAEGREKDWLTSNADSYMGSADAQAAIDKLDYEYLVEKSTADKYKDYFSDWWNKVIGVRIEDGKIDVTPGEESESKKLRDRKAELEVIKNLAERREKYQQFVSVTDENSEFYDPDFDAYVTRGSEGSTKLIEYRNDPQKAFEESAQAMRAGAGSFDSYSYKFAEHMEDDEYNTYLYYLGKYGKDKANEYLDLLEETVNQKEAGVYVEMTDNTLGQIFFAGVAGLDQFASGIKSLFSDEDYITPSSMQIASGIIREDLKENGIPYYNIKEGKWEDWDVNIFGSSAGQAMYDAISTTSNMLPSILASGIANVVAPGSGAFVGAGLMGGSAAGHGKAEMLNLGYSKGQANAYGLMVGASEAGLQYLLGGISSLGGNTSGLTKLALSKVDNALARAAITIGSGMVSEGFEEGLQTVIEPWLKEIATGVDWEDPSIDEILYSSLLGALSSLGLEGGQTVVGEVQHSNALKNTGKSILSSTNGYDALKSLATEVSSEGLVKGEADIKNLVEKTQKGAEAIKNKTASKHQANKTAKQVGKLSETVDSVRNEQNLAEIRSSLESKGLSKSKAQKAAELLNEALYTDGAYSKELYKSVMNDEGVWDTLRELVSSPESTLQSRNLKHKLGRVGLKVGKDGTIVSSVYAESTGSKYVDESLSFVEDASKRAFKASTEGKSIVKSTGDTIDIVEVASIENGQMMLKVKDTDGTESVVNAKDVEYSSGSEALVYEAVANMGLNAVSANSIIKSYNPTQDAGAFTRGMQEAYRYGKYNYSEYEMYQEGNFLLDLTEEQIQKAYKLGQIQSGSDTAVAVARLKEAIANSKGKKGEGKIHYEGDAVNITEDKLNDRQKTGLKTMEMLSKALGVDFYVYSSYTNKKGERVYKTSTGEVKSAPNGWYDKATGAMHIDLNAGNFGEGTMLFTVAHELTHFIKAWSPAKFKVLANFLVEQYGKKGVSVETLVRNQMAKMRENGRKNVTYDLAFEEFVADSMETMLTSGNVMESLAEIKRRDEGLWNKIKEFFSNLVDHLKKTVEAYRGFAPETIEGQTVATMKDAIEQFEKLFSEGLVDASENFRAISFTEQQTLAEVGIGFDEETRSVHSLRYSTGRKDALGNVIDLVTVGKKNFNTESIAQLVAKGTGRSIEDARKWVNSEIAIANIVMNNPEFLDFEADDRYEAIKKNSDYPQGTVDLSNLCPKRTEFTAMFDKLQKKYPDKLFTANDVAAMRNILKEKGITVACGACFVEDRRQLLGEIADTYIGMWKEAVETGKPLQKVNASGNKVTLTVTAALAKQYGLTKGSEILATDKYIPTQYDLTTYEGFKLLEKNHPTIAMGFNRYNNSRGQQAGRLIEGRAEYNRQILGWSPAKIKSVNNNGGLRIFSFSDFEVVHLLDLVQVILDCSAMGVKIQGYTKIPSFARLIRDTGIKINRSLIPKGQTGMKMVNGKQVLDYDTTEGIDINDENFIDERDNPNVGNILIGINPTQIGLAMLDDFVDYIIPFHTNKSKDICKALGLAEWVNYKESQHEKDIDTGKASKHNVNIYTEVINKYHPTNKVEFVDAFLKVCKAQKKIPRYSEFLNKEYKADGAYTDEYGSYDFTYREGYHKLLVDFKMFDRNGNILPQGEITPNLDDAFMAKLLKAEVDKKQNYKFPQEVYDRLDKEFGEDEVLYSERKKKVDETVDKAIKQKGNLGVKYNQKRISEFPADITAMVSAASDGQINLEGKYVAINGSDIWHEYERHSDAMRETGRRQIPFTTDTLKEAIMAIYKPDVIESLFATKENPTERQSFAYAKKSPNGYYIVVEAIGGNRNPNVVPIMLLQFTEDKWNDMMSSGLSLGEVLFENDAEKRNALDVQLNKKNRVTVAQFAFKKAIASTPRSPQFNNSVPQKPNSVNSSDENPHSDRKIVDIPNYKYAEMYRHFGSTKNYDVAGYMLGNGVMLDFSGKHWGDDYSTSRQVDHRDVQEVLDDRGNNGVNAMIDMIGNGNIRLMPEVGGINLAVKPNATQMTQLRGYINHFKGEVVIDIDKVGGDTIHSFSYTRGTSSSKILSDLKAYFDEGIVPEQKASDETDIHQFLYSDRNKAPTFYSHMGKVIDDIKIAKMGAGGVVSYLKGKGVKNEEIKWSGIEAFLEGKKSVTKEELREFVAGSMLSIEEEMSGYNQEAYDELEALWKQHAGVSLAETFSDDFDLPLTEDNMADVFDDMEREGYDVPSHEDQLRMLELARKAGNEGRWSKYKLGGGTNYRELVFKMPNSSYSNPAMVIHWGEDAEGVLAHTRVQDLETKSGKRMLFVEEIQSDWHNAGQKKGYLVDADLDALRETIKEAENLIDDVLPQKMVDLLNQKRDKAITEEEYRKRVAEISREESEANEKYHDLVIEYRNAKQRVPDAPFRNNYHEYVLKRLLRMAAEEGYDAIGWTTADIQSERWSDTYAEGYRIEYDQDIPKFLNKYGKKWGTKVSKESLPGRKATETLFDVNRQQKFDSEKAWKKEVKEELRNQGLSAREANATEFVREGEYLVAYDYFGNECDRAKVTTIDNQVWSMDITDSMKDSVLYEGQPMYSLRNKDSVSNRSLLANALESAVTNEFERKTLNDYKEELGRADTLEKELGEIRSKIRELSFAKGPKDTEAINKLREQEVKTVNRIDIRDKKLLRLEATKPLKDIIHREKEKAYKRAEQKGKEALAKHREKTAETQRELLNRWKESRKEAVENRHKSEVRTKIKNFKKKLESMLQHPTDRQYVPMGLTSAMIEVCELINTDTSLYKKDGSINKAQERRNLTKEKLRDLKDEYEKLKTNVDPMYSGEFDETVYAYLTDLQENYGGKNLNEMTLDELQEMYETLRAIEETLRDARKLIGWGDAADVYEAGDAIVSEQAEITSKRKNGKRNSAEKVRDKTLNYTLSPVRNVERMSAYNEDSYLLKLFKKFEQGIRKKNKFVMESYKLFESLTTGENAKTYEDAVYNEVGGKKYTDINGRTFGISKMQMMQAILSYEREEANHMNHINSGGFSFADLDMLRKGKLRDAVSEEYSHRIPLAVDMVEGFREALKGDKWAQDYMDTARKFFNEKAKDAINEASLAMKHRIVARDRNYIPFEVDKNFVVREISAQNDVQQTINSYGMLKSIKDGAPQPLIITGLNNILDRHIDQVGNVHGLAVEVRNFNKVWNVRALDAIGNDPTVKTALQRNWGVEGVKHIEQAVQDIQGARPNNQSALYRKIRSNYIGATFLLNLSVVTKQIGSLFASTSMLRYRSPIRMMANLAYTMANYKKIASEVDKYTATAWVRRQGISDGELQTLLTEGKKSLVGKLVNKLPTAINPTKWIQGMDSAVALSLWRYAKQDTAKRTGLTGEALLEATAEFYDEVVENTQSMADVLHRPEVQKEGGLVSDAFGMFKTDLYQMAGQLQVTAGRYSANKSKENGKALVRTASSIVMSAVWAQLMTTVFALLRYKVNPYRDEEDEELTAESWLKKQSFALTGDLVGYLFPLAGSEFVGIIENIVYGESEDAVDNIVITAVNDVFDTITTVATSVKDGEMPSVDDTQKLVTKALQLFGVPANNISRLVNAIRLHAKDIANGEFLSFNAGVERTPKHHVHRIVEAMASGKTDVAKGLFEEAVEELALRKAKDGEVTEDDIKEAKASLKTALGNKYKDGEVDFEIATEILSTLFEMGEEDIYWQFDSWDYVKENGTTDEYDKYDDLIEAVESGDPTAVINDLIEMKTATYYAEAKAEAEEKGERFNEKKALQEAEKKAKSSIKGVLTKHWKPLYKEAYKNKDTEEMKRIRQLLLATGVYGRASELLETVKGWLKD